MSRLRTAQYQRAQAEDAAPTAANDGDERRRAPPEVADWSDMADEQVLRSQLRRACSRAILALPAIYRAPVMLRDIQGMSTEEASAMLQREGSDAQVAAAPRPADPAQAAGRLRRRPHAAPADLRHVEALTSREARRASRRSAEAFRATAISLRATSCIALSSATRSPRSATASPLRRSPPARAAPAARRSASASPAASSGATKQLTRSGASGPTSRRSPSPPRPRARTGPAATARAIRAASRRRAGSSSSARQREAADRRVLPRDRRSDRGGTPRTVSATSRGDPFGVERDQRARAARPALRAPSRTAARARSAARGRRARRARAATRRRTATIAPARSATAASAAAARPRPAIRRRRRDRRRRRPSRRPPSTTSVAPDTRVANPSIGAACMMSSALPAATRPALVDQADRAHDVAARQHVRERAAELAGADDGDVAALRGLL